MKPATPVRVAAATVLAAIIIICAQFFSPDFPAQAIAAGDGVRVAAWESPLQKWKRQCRRSGGTYEKYCAGGVKHCCCYSTAYCEGMPEPAGTLQLPPPSGPGQSTTAPGLKPLRRAP